MANHIYVDCWVAGKNGGWQRIRTAEKPDEWWDASDWRFDTLAEAREVALKYLQNRFDHTRARIQWNGAPLWEAYKRRAGAKKITENPAPAWARLLAAEEN